MISVFVPQNCLLTPLHDALQQKTAASRRVWAEGTFQGHPVQRPCGEQGRQLEQGLSPGSGCKGTFCSWLLGCMGSLRQSIQEASAFTSLLERGLSNVL